MKKILLVLCLALTLSACAQKPAEPTETQAPTTEATTAPTTQPTEPEPTETEPVLYSDPLTGVLSEEKPTNLRPYAVMINNVIPAMPQCGTTKAEIMFEITVEGGLTRMMALFSDPTQAEGVGSIRSLRPYYLSIARSLDAIMVHAGASFQAYDDLEATGWDNLDGVNGGGAGDYYYRVQERIDNAGYEHSLFIDGDDILNYAEARDLRFDHEKDYEPPFRFTDDPLTDGDAADGEVVVHFGSSKETSFTYENGLYAGAQFGEPWADGNDGTVQKFSNLVILQADEKVLDDKGRISVDLLGEGPGSLVRNGKTLPITWHREAEGEPFVFTLADGTEMTLSRGRSYIAVVPTGSELECK